MECAKLIIQSGIIRVVFCDNYRAEEGTKLLQRAEIEIEYINLEENK